MTVMLDAMMLGYSRSQRCMLQVERQIDQMVKFIKQEAEEKANEISVSAEEVHRLAVLSLLCSQAGAASGNVCMPKATLPKAYC